MQSIQIQKPGGHRALRFLVSPDPQPGPGQVRVRVKAAGINYADCMVRMGLYQAARGLYPMVPGFEFAGQVDQLGAGAGGVSLGQRVLGITRFGGYSSSICVPAAQLWPCPEGWAEEDCAAFPAVYLTAYYGLFKVARAEAGESLLLHSAAGGVGSAALQLAKIAGIPATAVVGSAAKAALCRELGAEAVLDKSQGRLWQDCERLRPGGFDMVFDANGVATLRAGFEHLAPGGRLVVYGFASMLRPGRDRPDWPKLLWSWLKTPSFSPLELTSKNRSVMGFNVVHLFKRLDWADEAMRKMLGWAAEGKIRKVPVKAYAWDRAADAHRDLESGKTSGKLVLRFD